MERKGERQPERKWEFQMLRFYSFPALFGGKKLGLHRHFKAIEYHVFNAATSKLTPV